MYTANTRTACRTRRAAFSPGERLERIAWRIDRLPDGIRAALFGALAAVAFFALLAAWILAA